MYVCVVGQYFGRYRVNRNVGSVQENLRRDQTEDGDACDFILSVISHEIWISKCMYCVPRARRSPSRRRFWYRASCIGLWRRERRFSISSSLTSAMWILCISTPYHGNGSFCTCINASKYNLVCKYSGSRSCLSAVSGQRNQRRSWTTASPTWTIFSHTRCTLTYAG